MAMSGMAFVGYGIVFLVFDFVGGGSELDVDAINGLTRADSAIVHYIGHLHVVTAAFMIATGLAVTGLACDPSLRSNGSVALLAERSP